MPFYNFPRTAFLGYPKTGTTWIQLLFRVALTKVAKLTDRYIKEIFEMSQIEVSHNLPNFNVDTWQKQIFFFFPYRDKKILFITRDPRDTLLSLYMDLIYRVKYLDENYDINDFPEHSVWGINKYLKYHMFFEQDMKKNMFEKVVIARYEDFHKDTLGCFMNAAKELGMGNAIKEATAKYAVEFCKFENMKKMEEENALNWNPLSLIGTYDKVHPAIFKCRAGKVGEYKKYFNQKAIDFMNRKIKKEMPEVFGYE